MTDQDVDDRIKIEWYAAEGATREDLEAQAVRLREADDEADVIVVEPMGILPVLGWIVAAVGLVLLGREITELVCRLRRVGVIIDVRETPIKIREDSSLPGGTVLVIGKDGKSESHSVCDQKTKLADLIKSSM